MPTDIQCLTDDQESHTVVRIVGTLDLAGAVAVHTCLLKCLAEQPPVLLVDLSGMRLAEEDALTVFLAVARKAAMWPAVPMLLCGAEPATAQLLNAQSVARHLPMLPSVGAAVRSLELGGLPATPSLSEDLLPVTGAGRRAREVVTEACLRWDLPGHVAPACTVATELVNNVVAHAHTMMRLRISLRGRYLHIAVRDGSTEPPVRRDVPVSATAGRGLTLVEAVARQWGSLAIEGGKVVWAVLDT
ncbi:STAS domain-containing protein [Phytohabitans kaempferiae]|uniref:STAS domain-containing protein n=1 Tax=Phytohabitans kaempferiae TaxID=1620943 RepID=A0ABV6MGY9_9ACTN